MTGVGWETLPTPAHRAVRAYLDHLTVERALSAHTLSAYRRDLDRYLGWLIAAGVTDLAAVDSRRVGAYLAVLRGGDADHPPLAATSAARAISAVRGLHRFALRESLVADDPSREVTPPSPARRLPKALDVDAVLRLLAAAGSTPTPVGGRTGSAGGSSGSGGDSGPGRRGAGPDATGSGSPAAGVAADLISLRDRALLEFLYGTGARISEAVGADRDDLDLDAGTVVLRGKGGRARLVPVGSYARAAIEAYLVRARPSLAAAGRGTAAIFLNTRGGRLTRQSGWTVLRRAAEAAGLPTAGLSPHTLRHSYATHLLDGGADVRVVQELLGHASVTTTQVYTLVTVDRLREVYAMAHPRARG